MLLLYFLQNSSSYCLLSLFLQENYSPLSPYFFCPVLSLFLLELWTVAVLDCPGFPQSIYMVCSLLPYFSLCVSTLVISRELCIISAIPSVCCDKNPNESIKYILFYKNTFDSSFDNFLQICAKSCPYPTIISLMLSPGIP